MLQESFFKPDSDWSPPTSFPNLTTAKEVAIDLETYDPLLLTHGPSWALGQGRIIGICVATEGYKGYFPVAHENGANLDKGVVYRWLANLLVCKNDKIFHNAMYDVCWLKHYNIDVHGTIVDTMVMASLIDENRLFYSLNSWLISL